MESQDTVGHDADELVRLAFDIVSFDLAATLDVNQEHVSLFIADQLHVGDDCVSLRESQQELGLTLVDLVPPDFTDGSLTILHVNQVLSVKVKWDAVLSEL